MTFYSRHNLTHSFIRINTSYASLRMLILPWRWVSHLPTLRLLTEMNATEVFGADLALVESVLGPVLLYLINSMT